MNHKSLNLIDFTGVDPGFHAACEDLWSLIDDVNPFLDSPEDFSMLHELIDHMDIYIKSFLVVHGENILDISNFLQEWSHIRKTVMTIESAYRRRNARLDEQEKLALSSLNFGRMFASLHSKLSEAGSAKQRTAGMVNSILVIMQEFCIQLKHH